MLGSRFDEAAQPGGSRNLPDYREIVAARFGGR
jgi:hypothetical protein